MAGNIIKFCAPTLAGLKVGSMFSVACASAMQAAEVANEWNLRLNGKGVYMVCIAVKGCRMLCYVYRKVGLRKVLRDIRVRSFLRRHGYTTFDVDNCVWKLQQRIISSSEFPHEVGVFLGYPIEDIESFIEHSGCNALCVGCWKVYHNVDTAKELFGKYDKCTRIYMEKHLQGTDITKLTVS